MSTSGPLRANFRSPATRDGFIDAAWWPYTLDLTVELPPLLDRLWTDGHDVTRLTYALDAWDATPRRMTLQGRVMRLGGYATGGRDTVRLSDSWGHERIDVLVVAPQTEPALAQRILTLAGESGSLRRAGEILAEAGA